MVVLWVIFFSLLIKSYTFYFIENWIDNICLFSYLYIKFFNLLKDIQTMQKSQTVTTSLKSSASKPVKK